MDDSAAPESMNKAHKRSKNGCQTCRAKRKKCDETKPQCQRCIRTGSSCQWGGGIRFHYENISDPTISHPPTKRRNIGTGLSTSLGQARQPGLEEATELSHSPDGADPAFRSPRVGITVVNHEHRGSHARQTPGSFGSSPRTVPIPRSFHCDANSAEYSSPVQYSSLNVVLTPGDAAFAGSAQSDFNNTTELQQYMGGPYASSADLDKSNHSTTIERQQSGAAAGSHHFYGDAERITENTNPTADPGQSDQGYVSAVGHSPDVLTDDGIFLPGSTYQELHQTLRSQVLHIAQSRPNSRRTSHCLPFPSCRWDGRPAQEPVTGNEQDLLSSGSTTPPELTTAQEVLLWNNWINEISSWLDKFDHNQHFRYTLPALAQNISHLRYSMLALSARQLERKSKALPTATSLSLYQYAIHLLVPRLHVRDTLTLASCVILCVFEMSSCSPKAWRRHMDGCASLIMALGMRGDHGGLEQSLFWCFARMDVCGALISSEQTLIPVDRWITSVDPDTDQYRKFPIVDFENHASHVCYLLARVLELHNEPRSASTRSINLGRNSQTNILIDEWIRLFDELNTWYQNLPTEMKAILSIPSDPGNTVNPFHTLLFSSGAAVSGNQNKPRGISIESRSCLWHARQICAISMSNNHHGAWINCIQPVWLAGQLMSSPAEHRAIIDLYERIERETGWGAVWRAADLQTHWGDLT